MGHRLSRITTRTGDTGTTGLSDGSRIGKDAPRMEVIGTVDELSCQVGFANSLINPSAGTADLIKLMILIQHDLFDLGGALSIPDAELLTRAHVARVDDAVERMNSGLSPLKEFILPGGSPAVSALHVARTVARRAERRLISALEVDPQPAEHGLAYLNRVSDVLFVAARVVSRADKTPEVYWKASNSLA